MTTKGAPVLAVQMLREHVADRDGLGRTKIYPADWVGEVDDDTGVFCAAMGHARVLRGRTPEIEASIVAVTAIIEALRQNNINPTMASVREAIAAITAGSSPAPSDADTASGAAITEAKENAGAAAAAVASGSAAPRRRGRTA